MIERLDLPDSKAIGDLVKKLVELKPGQYIVEIKKHRPQASAKQRGYYHGVIELAIAVHLGWEKEEVRNYINMKFNATQVVNPSTGEIVIIPGTTSGKDTKEYAIMTHQIKAQWLPEMGLEVPEPEDVTDEYVFQLRKQYENRYYT